MRVPRDAGRSTGVDAPRRERAADAAAPSLLLALQGSVGNRAVSHLVARQEDCPAPAPVEAKTEQRIPSQVTVAGVGTIKLLAFSPAGDRERVEPGKAGGADAPKEFNFISRSGEHSEKLYVLLTSGKAVDADVVIPGVGVVHLKSAVVTRYVVDGANPDGNDLIEQWTLSATSSTFERQ